MEKYNEFYSLLNGEKEDEVTAVLEERKEKDTTLAGLESLQKMAKELTSVTASIKASTQDLYARPTRKQIGDPKQICSSTARKKRVCSFLYVFGGVTDLWTSGQYSL